MLYAAISFIMIVYTVHHLIIQANAKKLAVVQQMNMARDVALGMEYLSALGFIHKVNKV